MKRGREGGYTIVEVLIVLAVTAGLFAATAVLLTGRQAKTEFQQGVRDYETKIQSVISDVSSSFFPAGIRCVAGASGQPQLYPGTPEDPVTKAGCIFLGKTFMTTNSIQTMVGRHYKEGTTSTEISSEAEAFPNTDAVLTELYVPTYGVTLSHIRDIDTNADLTGVAFYYDFGVSEGGNDITGSRSMRLRGLTGASTNPASYIDVDDGVVFCIKGGNGLNAEITVGERGGSSGIATTMDTGVGQCG